MADTTILQLTENTSPSLTDYLVEATAGGINYKVTLARINTLFSTNPIFTGYVGIGCTPLAPLEIQQETSSSYPALHIKAFTGYKRATIGFGLDSHTAATTGFIMGRGLDVYTNDFYLVDMGVGGGTIRLYITTGGQIVFGQSAPMGSYIFTVSSAYGKTDTTYRGIAAFCSNDGATADGLKFGMIGAATMAARVSSLQTGDGGLNDGILSLQAYGGKVGIGTNAATQKLHVYDTANLEVRVECGGFTQIGMYASTNAGWIYTNNNYPLILGVNNTERVRITATAATFTVEAQAPNLQRSAEGQVISGLYSIVTAANIKGFWIFDQTGATSSITDRSGNAHTATLRNGVLAAINASTCTPGVGGLAPYLTFDSTHMWNTPDHNDFTFVGAAFTIISLINPALDSTQQHVIAKGELNQNEWYLYFDSANKLTFAAYKLDASANIGRRYNTSLIGDNGSWNSYIVTYDGGTSSSGLKVYRNGTQIDDTDVNAGSFTGMTNSTAKVANNYDVSGTPYYIFKGLQSLICVCAGALTAAQVRQVDYLLRAYAGVQI